MKSLAFFALSAIGTAALALQPTPSSSSISISGTSNQTASVNGGTLRNEAHSSAYANQNVASNKGGVEIKGSSTQTATLENATVTNDARSGGDVAVQNLASNVGTVTVNRVAGTLWTPAVNGSSTQTANVTNATVRNLAESNGCFGGSCEDAALAYQNVSSNMGNITVGGTSVQSTSISGFGTMVENKADGNKAAAVQNMSSNYGNVNISGYSNQSTTVGNGAHVLNLALGNSAHAVQNIASNDSCEPPPAVCVGPACGPYKVAGAN